MFILPLHLILQIVQIVCPTSVRSEDPMCSCQDYYGGCRKDGESWVDDGIWQYQCGQNAAEFKGLSHPSPLIRQKDVETISISGCLAILPAGRNQLVPPGQNVTIDGFWHFCAPTNAKVLTYKKEGYCDISGKKLHIGETFKNGMFKSACRDWGNEVVGCFVEDPEFGPLELGIGQQIEAGCYAHICRKESEFPWKIRYEARPKPDCVQSGAKAEQQGRLDPKRTVYPLHELADSFFKSDGSFKAKYRYLQ